MTFDIKEYCNCFLTGSRLWFQGRYMEFWNHSHRVGDRLCTLSPLPSHEGEHSGCSEIWISVWHESQLVAFTSVKKNILALRNFLFNQLVLWRFIISKKRKWSERNWTWDVVLCILCEGPQYFYFPQHFSYSLLVSTFFPQICNISIVY